MNGERRTYRSFVARRGLVGFHVRIQETDLHVQAECELKKEVSDWVIEARLAIEDYIRDHPRFLKSYLPLPDDPFASPIVQDMLKVSSVAGVGPMAAVAGAIAQYVGEKCMGITPGEVIVENGGDIFLWVSKPVTSAIWAGNSPLSGQVGIVLAPGPGPFGICTSSGTVGHSRSLGSADAVTMVSQSVSLADAAATAVGNTIKTDRDIGPGLELAEKIPGILGGVIIKGSRLGAWGQLELVPL
ncbi:MAG: UPF0280 family protein [Nitrospiraceae bacterium]|nr:UPF0280 family protein [Nitrospiraceae bacterium]